MLTLKIMQKNGVESIEEINHATINHETGGMYYRPAQKNSHTELHPDAVSQAFVMNENGKTVMSHNFVVPKTEVAAG